MAIGANPIGLGIDGTRGTGLGASIRTGVISGEELEKSVQEKKTTDYFNNRQKINNDIVTGKITSGNPGKDTITVRKNNLVSLFAADALEKGANPDKVMAITKKPDEILKRLTGLGEQQANAVNEYLMNGGYADRVFDYVMGKSKNPYSKVEEQQDRTVVGNTLKSALGTIVESAAGLLDISGQGIDRLSKKTGGETQDEEDLKNLNELVSSVSTDEYNKYKSQGLEGSKFRQTGDYKAKYGNYDVDNQTFVNAGLISKAGFYDEYDKAKEDGFDGSVEDYANYKYNVASKISNGISEATKNYLQSNLYDPEQAGAGAGKFVGNLLELLAMPEKTGIKLLSKAPKLVKNVVKLGDIGLQIQALDDLNEGEISNAGDYLTTAGTNILAGGILNGVGNILSKSRPINAAIKWLGSPNKASQNAIGTKTLKEWDEMSKISENAAADYNAEVTPRTKILDKLEQLRQTLVDKRIIKGQKLEDIEGKIKYDWKRGTKYDANDMLKEIENGFKELGKKKKWGKNAKYPEFFKDGETFLDEETKKVLNSYTRDQGDKVIKLGDEMETLWDDIFTNTDRAIDATTSQEFYKGLKSLLKDKGWTRRGQGTRVFRDAFDQIKSKFSDSLSKPSQKALEAAEKESSESIRISNLFDDMVGRLENRPSGVKAAQGAEKAVQGDEATKELFKIIKKYTGVDMNNEVGAWVANMSIYNPEYARRLAETIYPSAPGMYEFLIKNILGNLKKHVSRSYTKDYSSASNKGVWGTINNAVNKVHQGEQKIINSVAPVAGGLGATNMED